MKITICQVDIPVMVCTKLWSRFKGMMFIKKRLHHGYLFPHCNSIHTCFMRQPIDIIMTDQKGIILYYYPNIKPWRIILPKKGAINTYEFSIGILPPIHIGDLIQ